MTTFPELKPDSWPLRLGEFPASEETAISGKTSIVRYSSTETGREISGVLFVLTNAEYRQLLAHHEAHGSDIDFNFSTNTFPAGYTLSGHLWYYSADPEVNELHTDYIEVVCSFRSRLQASVATPAEVAYVVAEIQETVNTPPAATPPTPTLTIANATGSAATIIPGSSYATVGGLDGRYGWEYSLDGGSTWTTGSGQSFLIPPGSYSAGAIRVRQIGGAAASTALPVLMPAPNSASAAIAVGAGATVTGNLTIRPFYVAVRIKSSLPGWLTVYGWATAASADASRSRGTPPESGSGVFHDPVFVAGSGLDFRLSPLETVCNGEDPETSVFPFRFRNDGAAGELVITIYYKQRIV